MRTRNILIQREDGTKVVRPFRGLRNATKSSATKPPAANETNGGWNPINDYAIINQTMAMDHRKMEQRSLVLHREIARQLRGNRKASDDRK
jgi:hypothetical protein